MTAIFKFHLGCKYSLHTLLLYVCILLPYFVTFVCRSKWQHKVRLAAPSWVNAGYFLNLSSDLIFKLGSWSTCSWKYMVKGSAMHNKLHKHIPYRLWLIVLAKSSPTALPDVVLLRLKLVYVGFLSFFLTITLTFRCARNLFSFSAFFSLDLVFYAEHSLRPWKSQFSSDTYLLPAPYKCNQNLFLLAWYTTYIWHLFDIFIAKHRRCV